MTEVAYAWALGDPRVTAILVGPRNPDQLAEATRALELRLSDDDRRELAGFFAPGPS
jgi:aryl-alcohol dehydrogenase-like predicted oxidoreductase